MASWTDRVLVLGWRRFGEHDAILDVFGESQGRARGLVRGGAGRKRRAGLEPGNRLEVEWRGRLAEQLGFFSGIELMDSRAALIFDDALALSALGSVLGLLSGVLAEGLPKPEIYASTEVLFEVLPDREVMPAVFVRWEAGVLSALGYGLDLRCCVLTGSSEDLRWVSPRSGRAVCALAGKPWEDRLWRLPSFMIKETAPASPGDIGAGFRLTGYFLEKGLMLDRHAGLPAARERFMNRLRREGLVEMEKGPGDG